MSDRNFPDRSGPPVIVVGAGVAGLAAAARLAQAGLPVTVLERHAAPGGKIRALPSRSGPVNTGPTVLTMRHVFDDLFAQLGTRLEDHVTLHKQDVLARHFWPDGSTLDLYADHERSAAAVRDFAGSRGEAQFRRFCARAQTLFDGFNGPMMQSATPSPTRLIAHVARHPHLIRAMAPASSLAGMLRRSFDDPRLAQLFGRYATYVGGAPLYRLYPRDMGVVVKHRTMFGGQIGERLCQPRHAALDHPDPCGLGLPDEGQKRRHLVRRAADIGGVAPEQLRKARVVEAAAEHPRERRRGRHCADQMRVSRDMRDQPRGRGGCRLHHRAVEAVEQRLRARAKAAELRLAAGSCEIAHRRRAALVVGIEIKRAAIGPEMPRQHILPVQGHVILQPGAKLREKIVEDVAHGQHGGPGIHRTGARGQGADLAAGGRVPFQDGDREPGLRQPRRRCEPGDARAHDDHGWAALVREISVSHWGIVDSNTQCVQYDLHITCHTLVTYAERRRLACHSATGSTARCAVPSGGGRAGLRRSNWPRRSTMPRRPAVRASGRRSWSPLRWRAATIAPRSLTGRLRHWSLFTARASCMMICPVSTMPICGAASRRCIARIPSHWRC